MYTLHIIDIDIIETYYSNFQKYVQYIALYVFNANTDRVLYVPNKRVI